MSTIEHRLFASIICTKCSFLEFPGCDTHGLYTEFLPGGQAKCPSCSATTDNVRPFKDGCRRCNGATKIEMWCSTITEFNSAYGNFPSGLDEIKHTVLRCDRCSCILFPSSRDILTIRTSSGPLTTSNLRQLRISNFQLAMIHVQQCPRAGMPLQSIPVILTKSEINFVQERIEQCPIVPPISSKSQYLPRKLAPPDTDNPLTQFFLYILSNMISEVNVNNPKVQSCLNQIAMIYDDNEPLVTFKDWSPPKELPESYVQPKCAIALNEHSDQHTASRVLDTENGFWRSMQRMGNTEESVFIGLEFDSTVEISSLIIRWHPKYAASKYTVNISQDGEAYETIMVVTDREIEKRVTINKKTKATHMKIKLLSSVSSDGSYGVYSLRVYTRNVENVYTPSIEIINNIRNWLFSLTTHKEFPIRTASLRALNGLAMSSGSLCVFLRLIQGLLNTISEEKPLLNEFPEPELCIFQSLASRMSQLVHSNTLKSYARVKDDTPSNKKNEAKTQDSGHDHITREAMQLLRSLHGYNIFSQSNLSQVPLRRSTNDRSPNVQEEHKDTAESKKTFDTESDEPFMKSQLLSRLAEPSLQSKLRTPVQMAIFIILHLGELSVGQMHQMQKAEGGIEGQGGQFPLEEPLSIQVDVETFELCHQLLQYLEGTITSSNIERVHRPSLVEETKIFSNLLNNESADKEYCIAPETLSLSILQVVSANLRRLVLSRVNPVEVGIDPVSNTSECLEKPSSALTNLFSSLEKLILSGTNTSDPLFPLSLEAATAMEYGMETIYPLPEQRTKILTSRMGKGATIEVQFRWPAEEGDQEDPRYERLLLLLQLECNKYNMNVAMRGHWKFYIYLIISIAEDVETEFALNTYFAPCIQEAGFSSWQVIAGAQEISIVLQRHLHWNRVEKMSHDAGSGWIRVYPKGVAKFDDVVSNIESFVSKHQNQKESEYEE